jgi:hypothetical protein
MILVAVQRETGAGLSMVTLVEKKLLLMGQRSRLWRHYLVSLQDK